MKRIKKLLLPLSMLTIASAIVPTITSCSTGSADEDPYVILPTKHIQVEGQRLTAFQFQIKDKGTIYDHIDATATVTGASRSQIKVSVQSSELSDENHSFTIIVFMYNANENETLTGGDYVEFDFEIKCFKPNETNPDWTTKSAGYRIDYKAAQTTDLFEIDEQAGESYIIKTITGWAAGTTETDVKAAIALNDGVFEFPYAINKISNQAALAFPSNCKTLRFRSDSQCDAIYGQIKYDEEKPTVLPAPGSFDLTSTWHVKNIVINPNMIIIGNKDYYDKEAQLNQVVFPSLPEEEKNNCCIDLTAWTATDIAKIAKPKTPTTKDKPANVWTWSNDAFYNYKKCEYSVIKVKQGTRDAWFDYFGYTAGFKFFDKDTKEKRWWRIEEVA